MNTQDVASKAIHTSSQVLRGVSLRNMLTFVDGAKSLANQLTKLAPGNWLETSQVKAFGRSESTLGKILLEALAVASHNNERGASVQLVHTTLTSAMDAVVEANRQGRYDEVVTVSEIEQACSAIGHELPRRIAELIGFQTFTESAAHASSHAVPSVGAVRRAERWLVSAWDMSMQDGARDLPLREAFAVSWASKAGQAIDVNQLATPQVWFWSERAIRELVYLAAKLNSERPRSLVWHGKQQIEAAANYWAGHNPDLVVPDENCNGVADEVGNDFQRFFDCFAIVARCMDEPRLGAWDASAQ